MVIIIITINIDSINFCFSFSPVSRIIQRKRVKKSKFQKKEKFLYQTRHINYINVFDWKQNSNFCFLFFWLLFSPPTRKHTSKPEFISIFFINNIINGYSKIGIDSSSSSVQDHWNWIGNCATTKKHYHYSNPNNDKHDEDIAQKKTCHFIFCQNL